MSDIVERLRGNGQRAYFGDGAIMYDAAAEIERLRAGYEHLARILTKQSLASDERISDALAFVRYITTSRAALEEK